jgi:hypothetical protein
VFLEQPPLGTSRSKELKAKRTQKSLVARKVKGLNRIVKVSYDNLRFNVKVGYDNFRFNVKVGYVNLRFNVKVGYANLRFNAKVGYDNLRFNNNTLIRKCNFP